jgi:hypothetical protein
VSAEPISREAEDRILSEAAARLSLVLFQQERDLWYTGALAEAFVRGYVDGKEGAALERAVDHHGLRFATGSLAAFAYGWCRGRADLLGHKPTYAHVESWLARRASGG